MSITTGMYIEQNFRKSLGDEVLELESRVKKLTCEAKENKEIMLDAADEIADLKKQVEILKNKTGKQL